MGDSIRCCEIHTHWRLVCKCISIYTYILYIEARKYVSALSQSFLLMPLLCASAIPVAFCSHPIEFFASTLQFPRLLCSYFILFLIFSTSRHSRGTHLLLLLFRYFFVLTVYSAVSVAVENPYKTPLHAFVH